MWWAHRGLPTLQARRSAAGATWVWPHARLGSAPLTGRGWQRRWRSGVAAAVAHHPVCWPAACAPRPLSPPPGVQVLGYSVDCISDHGGCVGECNRWVGSKGGRGEGGGGGALRAGGHGTAAHDARSACLQQHLMICHGASHPSCWCRCAAGLQVLGALLRQRELHRGRRPHAAPWGRLARLGGCMGQGGPCCARACVCYTCVI